LNEVRKGYPLIVTDHGKPIAKLEAIKEGEYSSSVETMANLNKSGALTFDFKAGGFDSITPIDLGGNIASKMISEGRD
jgi:hypothetical protein